MTQPTVHRAPCVLHCTSEPYRFFGRESELAVLEEAFAGGAASVVALVGPGGQGKTALVQHWLEPFLAGARSADGVFLWSFYRGKDADVCLRQLHAYAEGLLAPADVSASYCVDHLLPPLRRERWALVLDGVEVVQHDSGPWFGRFIHPELERLLEELAAAPMPGVVLLTTRFPLPELERRRHVRIVSLGSLDAASARGLLQSVGVTGTITVLDAAAQAAGFHAKAVELLGTLLHRFHDGNAARFTDLSEPIYPEDFSDDERRVARVLAAFQAELPAELQDVLALATAFRDPPEEDRLLAYLVSAPVRTLLHETWQRDYQPFAERPGDWLRGVVQELIDLRLLERVGGALDATTRTRRMVLDAHPLVRRGFEHVLGTAGRHQSAVARAGFLRGRPDRRRPATLEDAAEEIELFHAYADAGLWNEADEVYVALENPKHRFLAPAFERDLLLRFFPAGDWRLPPLWSGFGRYRSLAISLELLGRFDDALEVYRGDDAPLRGDALIALGRLAPLLDQAHVPHPWQTLWSAYRCHALAIAGRTDEAVSLARSLVPVDVYEWVHVFECLLRTGRLDVLDLRSVLYRPAFAAEQRWAELARRRMQADYSRVRGDASTDLGGVYGSLAEEYDRGGLPFERCLTRLGHARWLLSVGRMAEAAAVNATTLDIARRHGMRIIEADALALANQQRESESLRQAVGYHGPLRP